MPFHKSLIIAFAYLFMLLVSPSPLMSQNGPAHSTLERFFSKPGDSMVYWWRAGYPNSVGNDLWQICMRSGNYAMVFDTRTLSIPHLGHPTAKEEVGTLPPAKLDIWAEINGKTYRAVGSQPPTRFTGPRLIESGVFLQRFDVTDLIFKADDGQELNQESRLEVTGLSNRLGFKLAIRPGLKPIADGEASFGLMEGGFGLTKTKRLDISAEEMQIPAAFTLSFWVFVPTEFSEAHGSPVLMSSHNNEVNDGHVGITLDRNGAPTAHLNIGGGAENLFEAANRDAQFQSGQWNFVAVTYDGDFLRLYLNGSQSAQTKIGRARVPHPGHVTFGDRNDIRAADNLSRRFYGVLDEIQLHGRALSADEIRRLASAHAARQESLPPMKQWIFKPDVPSSRSMISEQWKSALLRMRFEAEGKISQSQWQLPSGNAWVSPNWEGTSLAVDPVTLNATPEPTGLSVEANEVANGNKCPVIFDHGNGCFIVNLNQVEPTPPPGGKNPSNDALERIKLRINNTSPSDQYVRLMFDKDISKGGFRQRIGSPVTGISAILCEPDGTPTGLPVQLSKNWHVHPKGGVYSGIWFHGVGQIFVPKGESLDLELRLAYGHWGRLPTASHAQLSLIGWGTNQLWEQAALGAWGESICYDPEQANAACTITDVRPLMVPSMTTGGQWDWTHNHGGGDFFRFFNPEGKRVAHSRVRSVIEKYGPCLTDAIYTGEIHETGIFFSERVSLFRTDDLVTATFRIKMNVTRPIDFSRFVIFQVGADSYVSTKEKKFAVGNKGGLLQKWNARWGGDQYKGEPITMSGEAPWVSLHDAFIPGGEVGVRSNRGFIIRHWKATLGGKEAPPLVAERGINRGGSEGASTIDIVPPLDLKRFEPGDFIDATIELVLPPRQAADYYGPNAELRAAIAKTPNSWELVHRQAAGGDLVATPLIGQLARPYPGIQIAAENNRAEFTLQGGVSHVPITITNLDSHKGYQLSIDGKALDQSVHGNDFWQTNFDPATRKWSRTYNIPPAGGAKRTIFFGPK